MISWAGLGCAGLELGGCPGEDKLAWYFLASVGISNEIRGKKTKPKGSAYGSAVPHQGQTCHQPNGSLIIHSAGPSAGVVSGELPVIKSWSPLASLGALKCVLLVGWFKG